MIYALRDGSRNCVDRVQKKKKGQGMEKSKPSHKQNMIAPLFKSYNQYFTRSEHSRITTDKMYEPTDLLKIRILLAR